MESLVGGSLLPLSTPSPERCYLLGASFHILWYLLTNKAADRIRTYSVVSQTDLQSVAFSHFATAANCCMASTFILASSYKPAICSEVGDLFICHHSLTYKWALWDSDPGQSDYESRALTYWAKGPDPSILQLKGRVMTSCSPWIVITLSYTYHRPKCRHCRNNNLGACAWMIVCHSIRRLLGSYSVLPTTTSIHVKKNCRCWATTLCWQIVWRSVSPLLSSRMNTD